MTTNRTALFGLILSIAAIALGCGDSGIATVSGAVTYEGEPVMDGMITFTPADGKGPVAGGRIIDGRYGIEKLTPGTKLVKVEAVKAVPFARSSEEIAPRRREPDEGGRIRPDRPGRRDTRGRSR